jgi:hypothetical protein
VFELGSASDAEREQQAQLAEDQHPKPVHFAVTAISGAVGFAYPNSQTGGGGANVLFREGRCVLLVGDEDNGAANFREPALAGAIAVWRRTHGRPGVCST